MPVSPDFTVDEDSSPEAAARALTNLNRMVRYGRMAEKALAEIKSFGFSNRLAPGAEQAGSRYGRSAASSPGSGQICKASFRRFPKIEPFGPSDIGDTSLLRLELGAIEDTQYSGHPCKEVKLLVAGPMIVQKAFKSGRSEYYTTEDSRSVGGIRINKAHLSWLEPARYSYGRAHPIRKGKYDPSSVDVFALALSKIIVALADSEIGISAKTLSIQNTAHLWLGADGTADRLFKSIYDLITVAEIMTS